MIDKSFALTKKILVTGGAGFLGSHLIDRLLERNHFIYCLDDLSTGSKNNISHLNANPRFKFLNANVEESIDLQVDEIYNLACPASPPKYQLNPVSTFKTCVLGALNVLELAKKCGCPVLQASTSEIYGDPLIHPQPESYWGNVNPIGPRSCYDEGKRAAETLFSDYRNQYAVNSKIVRIFNTYGPRMDQHDGRVISNFINQALRNEPITLFGTGDQTRSFCYVDDLIDGLIKAMENPNIGSNPINLGNDTEFTIKELAARVVAALNSKSQISFKELPMDDPKRRKPDIRLAIQILGWKPTIQLDQGLAKTIEHFEKFQIKEDALG